MNKVKMILVSSFLLTSLSACAHKPEVLPTPRLVYTCPTLQSYSQDTLTGVQNEILKNGKDVPYLLDMLSGYMSLRDAVKNCQRDSVKALTNSSLN